jgi:hypothetical protein
MKKLATLMLVLVASCGDDDGNTSRDSGPDDAIVDAPDAACFEGTPTTHEEIMNACTPDNVTKIFKDSHPPLLNADGTLPPLPP